MRVSREKGSGESIEGISSPSRRSQARWTTQARAECTPVSTDLHVLAQEPMLAIRDLGRALPSWT